MMMLWWLVANAIRPWLSAKMDRQWWIFDMFCRPASKVGAGNGFLFGFLTAGL
jgi:hypothetical protein